MKELAWIGKWDQTKVLHVRDHLTADWVPYYRHPHKVADYLDGGSNGMATMHKLLRLGEWVSGEWLAQAHGTIYELQHEPFVIFDLWKEGERISYVELIDRIDDKFEYPRPIHLSLTNAIPCSVEIALQKLEHPIGRQKHGAIGEIEGCVWRVERNGKVDFLCKYVRLNKKDGIYLPELNGTGEIIWNKGLEVFLPSKALNRIKGTE